MIDSLDAVANFRDHLITSSRKKFVHGKLRKGPPPRQRICKKNLNARHFVSAEFRKTERPLTQTARSGFFDHDGVTATNRIRRIAWHSTRFEDKDVALYQRQIEMPRISRAIVEISVDL